MATSVIMMELLGRGVHANPRRGCNVLEYASVLAGERSSSRPRSVHPALADVVGMVNDQMTDDNRRLLTPLAPWLLGTSTADPRAWPAITGACIRAALAWASEPGKPRLKADLDTARNWLAEASRPPDGRRRPPWAGRRERRWARHAICTALLTVAASADQDDADASLCQVLLNCVNECQRLRRRVGRGSPAAARRLSAAPGGRAAHDVAAELRLDGGESPAGPYHSAGIRGRGSGAAGRREDGIHGGQPPARLACLTTVTG